MTKNVLCGLLWLALSTACGEPPTHGDELDPTLEPSDFYQREQPTTSVVPLALGSPLSAELSRVSPRYVFSFVLTGEARVALRTEATFDDGELDTVLTLYRVEPSGKRKRLAENDDTRDSLFSALQRKLGAGSYQVDVRGFRPRVAGGFMLASECTGVGCPAALSVCLFGEVFHDLREHDSLQVEREVWIEHEGQLAGDIERAQLVLAVQQSSHDDVQTPSEALQRVDEQKIRQLQLHEREGERAFTVYEYGAGDNSYGAIFTLGTSDLVASIHDGDLLDCTVTR